MELTRSSVTTTDLLSIAEYCDKYGQGVTPQAISYAIENDKIDYVWMGKERFVVMTDKTKLYRPNASAARNAKLGGDVTKQ